MTVEEALATVEVILGKESFNNLEEIIFRSSWEQKTYPEIAEAFGYDAGYVKLVGFQLWKMLSDALGEKVTKNNIRSVLRRWQARSFNGTLGELQATPAQNITEPILSEGETTSISNTNIETSSCCRQDWGEAIDVSVFYGRSAELATLEQWIIQERCRLVALLGIGGIGKTALSIKLAEKIQSQFEYIIWRSLHNAPSLESLLTSLIQFLSNQQEIDLPKDVSYRISRLLDYLRSSRCLLVLDNAETILCNTDTLGTLHGCRAGYYREGYEGYGELFKRIGELRHNSCLLLTSREKPKEIAALEGETFPVRSLQLPGLTTADGEEIFRAKGNFYGAADDWQTLIQWYTGNPLALKIVSTTIRDLFASNISKFIKQGTVVFGDIQELLEQQFLRNSMLEKEIMYWLAINREPVAIAELQTDLLSPILPNQLLEALESLERRSMIEKSAALFTLQPVLMEYVTNRLVKKVCQEIETQKILLFKNHALIKATAKDYVRETQIHFILKPVIIQLVRAFGTPDSIDSHLMQILSSVRGKSAIETGYVGGNTINLLRQLQLNLSEHDFSGLTIWQADLQGINLYRVNFSRSDLAKSTFTKNFSYIFAMAVSPDGSLLATFDSYGKIRLWRVADGQQLLIWDGHTGWARSIAFSPDGKTLVSGSDDRTVKVWDVTTGQCLSIFKKHAGWVLSVAFSPQGKVLASGSEDQTAKLWDVSTGQCRQTLQGHTGWVCSVAFSPNVQTLASGSADQTIKLWDINTGQCLKTLHGHKGAVWFVTFSADGQTLISSSEDQTVKLWNVKNGLCHRTLPGHKGWVLSVAFSCDNKTLAIGSADQMIKLWDISTGQQLRTLQHSSGVRSIVFSADGQTLISSDEDQTIKLWDVSTGQCLRTFWGYSSGVWSIALGHDGQTLVSSGADQMVRLWNVSDGRCMRTFKGHTSFVRSVAYSPDGQTVASGSADQTVKVWDVSDGRCLRTFKGHTSWVISVIYSPDGQNLASSGLDQMVRIWDISTGQCLRVLQGHTSLVLSVTYSPQGNTLASGGGDQVVRLWDVNTGQCFRVLEGHTNWVWPTAFSPQGNTLASGSTDHTVRIWDIRDGKCLRILEGHTNWINSLAYSPDGQTLASGSLDHTVRVWDVRDGKCLQVLQGHTRWVLSVAFTHLYERFSHDLGQVLASSSDDQTIRFWDIKTGQCLKILRSERPYEGMNITGVVGLTEAQKVTLKALGAVEY